MPESTTALDLTPGARIYFGVRDRKLQPLAPAHITTPRARTAARRGVVQERTLGFQVVSLAVQEEGLDRVVHLEGIPTHAPVALRSE